MVEDEISKGLENRRFVIQFPSINHEMITSHYLQRTQSNNHSTGQVRAPSSLLKKKMFFEINSFFKLYNKFINIIAFKVIKSKGKSFKVTNLRNNYKTKLLVMSSEVPPPTCLQFKLIAWRFSNKKHEEKWKFQQKLPSISAIRQSRVYKEADYRFQHDWLAKTNRFL